MVNTATAAATNNSIDTSMFYPQLHGKLIEYYFYPNSTVPVFCPTIEQFKDFEALVTAIEPLSLRAGVCKIIPPKIWREELERRNRDRQPSADFVAEQNNAGHEWRVFSEDEFPIMKPIVQHFNGSGGIFHQYNVEFHRKLKLAQFFQMSQDTSHRMPEIKIDKDDQSARERAKKDSARDKHGVKLDENSDPASSAVVANTPSNGQQENEAVERQREAKDGSGAEQKDRVYESDVVGIAVDYKTGEVRLTSKASETLQQGIRSESIRAKYQPATTAYRPYPEDDSDPAPDQNGARPPRQFTADDGRALFVSEKEYAENEELERIYWKNMLFQPPMYGADVLGTLFPDESEFPAWNIRNLPGLLRKIGQKMPGVNDPYLYLGMWKATFAWHVEDMDLYSINYIHFGAPKAWYSIPIDARSRFEMSMQNVFATDYKACSQFLRHKAFLLSPRFLALQGIPYNRVVQRAGEIMLTFPLGYHAGFNHGFNCAESVNFALDRWLSIAKTSRRCECIKDSVTIDLMEWFSDSVKDTKTPEEQQQEEEFGDGIVVEIIKGDPHYSTSQDDDDVSLRDRLTMASRRASPRRHAAAAATTTKTAALPATPKKPGRLRKSDPLQQNKGGGADEVDPSRRLGSLHTPVGVCGACLLPIDGITVRDGEIINESQSAESFVECGQCGLTVHSSCSALTFDDGNYKCANCVMDTDQLSCALCAYQNGLLLPVQESTSATTASPAGSPKLSSRRSSRISTLSQQQQQQQQQPQKPKEFAHFLCANFVNETFFDFPAPAPESKQSTEAAGGSQTETANAQIAERKPPMSSVKTRSQTAAKAKPGADPGTDNGCPLLTNSAKVCGVHAVAKGRWTMRCMFCDDSDSRKPCFGAVVQCSYPKCFRAFHPVCAAINDLQSLDWETCKIYCPNHTK
ncbi:hypothetical protein GGI12_002103 [Dipsacomyces acuminosporus]|nr:hypothetical protein GGI12_002103 [Dipsacomyces acuminosporus]